MRKQLHIILRLVMFCCILLFVSQEVSAQITFSVKNQTIRQTIRVIEKKADYSFFYTDKLPGLDQKISLKVDNESIDSVLEKVFKGSPISYKIESGKQVVLTLKTEQNASQKGDKKTITGVVADRRGEPLIGVTVRVEGENIGTATDIDGRFSLEAPIGAKISFSYIGYVSQSHTVNKQNIYNVSLSEDSQVLEEVVVVGYGSMKRKDITTAVSVVSTADIEERPIMTAAQAIQGKAAGIQVVQPSGMPGSGVTIRVRGATSVQASNEPLYVVDGLPSDDISNISPNDIESMQILKDASSAAIYGARAANGVVLITTKRGKIGAPQVKMSAYVGFSKLGKKIDALNTEQYKDLMKDLKAVSDVAPNIPENETRYVDWTDLFFGTGVNQNYQLSVANGTEKLQYFVSGGYSDEQGIVEKAHFNRYNFRANLDSEQTKWLKMALNFAYSHTGGQWVNESRSSLRAGSILSVVNTPPFMQKWNPYDPNEYDEQAYGARILNPLAANAADSNTNTDHINGSLGFTVDIYKGLKFKTTFGIELTNEHWDYYLDPISTSDGRGTKGRVEESFSRNFEWLFENLLTYDCSFNKHNLSILGGATQQRAQYNASWMAGFDLAESYPDIHSISAANQLDKDACGSSASAWTLASFLGRIAYNYDSRYLLTVNFRADGSSRFAPGHRWGFFPSFSAGYDMARTDYFKGWNLPFSQLKLRVSYGRLGNQNGAGLYDYLGFMNLVPDSTDSWLLPGVSDTPSKGVLARTPKMISPYITWEKVDNANLGIDLMLFRNRLSVTADIYQRTTRDMIGPAEAIPSISGINTEDRSKINNATLRNRGWELSVNWQDRLKCGFSYGIGFNISDYKAVVTKYNNPEGLLYNNHTGLARNKGYYEGMDIGEIWGFQADDLFRTNREVDEYLKTVDLSFFKPGDKWQRGDVKYIDSNHDGKVDSGKGTLADHGDLKVIGNATPKYSFGFNLNAGYKGFEVSALFQGVAKRQFPISGAAYFFGGNSYFKEHLDHFNAQNPEGYLPRLTDDKQTLAANTGYNTTRYLLNAAYMRLKNLTVSYSFKPQLVQHIGLSNLRVYVTCDNLFTVSKLPKQFDPETLNQVNGWVGGSNDTAPALTSPLNANGNGRVYPMNRNFVFGIDVTF